MTLVLGMRFSPNSGILIVDEQASNRLRKIDIADKIHEDGQRPLPGLVFAGSGTSDILYRTALEYFESSDRGPQAFHRVVQKVRNDIIDEYLQAKYGVSSSAFHTGLYPGTNEPMNRSLMERIERFYESDGGEIAEHLRNTFVLLEPDGMRLSISGTVAPTLLPVARPYEAIGSGSDSAELSMSRFYDRIPRERRSDLGFNEGMRGAIIAADEASRRNMGVGGVPSMAIVKDGTFHRPSQRNSRLAVEIVHSDAEGLLSDGFVDEVLEQLIEDENSFASIDRAFHRAAKNRRDLGLFLRGYIV